MVATIKPGTTPLLTIDLPGVAIQDMTVYVALDQRDRILIKSNYNNDASVMMEAIIEDGIQTGTELNVQFSQHDTLCLRPGRADVEVRWIDEDGVADKTDIGQVKIPRTLFRGVIAYGRRH